MDTQLTHAARIQLARSLRQRYQAASSRAKKQILHEFIAVSGYHPKYAVHLLNAADGAAAPRRGRVRPTADLRNARLQQKCRPGSRVIAQQLSELLTPVASDGTALRW
jgi:hypothetical protein